MKKIEIHEKMLQILHRNMRNHKSPAEVRDKFRNCGISVADWARSHGFTLPLVYSVLSGRSRAVRGESYRIAVALGLRAPPDPQDVFELANAPAMEGRAM